MKTKILFVDDNHQFLESYQELLETQGYNILTATNVSDALKVFVKNPDIELVLTDLNMPEYPGAKENGESGLHFLESIKLQRPNLPVVVLSGFLEPFAVELSALGVSALIPKGSSYQLETLKATIRKLLKNTSSANEKSDYSNLTLETFRSILIEEMNKLTPIKERTIFIPQEGQYELIKPLVGFKKEIENQLNKFPFSNNVFLMMRFRSSNKDLSDFIIENLGNHGLRGVRADQNEWNITRNVYNPIAVLYCCKYGIALFDEPEENQAYSANVAYELGMMHYQNKDCLILRHNTLPPTPFDLIKDLYVSYDKELQMKIIIANWIKQIVLDNE